MDMKVYENVEKRSQFERSCVNRGTQIGNMAWILHGSRG